MKKAFINAFFLFVCVIMCVFIFTQKSRFDSDIYALLNINLSPHQKEAILQNANNLKKEFMFLSDDLSVLKDFENLAKKAQIFSEISAFLEDSNSSLNAFKALQIASFKDFDKLIKNERFKDENAFLQEVAKRIFSPISFLPLKDDFLGLYAHSSLLNNGNFTLDLSNSALYTEFKGKRYYFAKASLKENFSSTSFLNFLNELENLASLKNAEIYAHSGAIFELKARIQGENEGLFMSFFAVFLLGILAFFAFGKLSAFRLIFIIAFALLGGLCAALLCFEKVHFLSLIISTSLIGLILDFSLHYLSFNAQKDINLRRQKLLKVFCIGLFITTSAYALFLFSHSLFLEQIAIISIFSLFFSFLATYFWLPNLINADKFTQKNCFKKMLFCYFKILRYPRIKGLFVAFFIIILAFIFWQDKFDFSDDIKSYSAMDEKYLAQSVKFFEISRIFSGSDMIIIKGGVENEQSLINSLLEQGLISDYEALSKYFLSPVKQESLKTAINAFLSSPANIKFFENLGFTKNELENFRQNYAKIPILSQNDFLTLPFSAEFKHFLLDENHSLITLKNANKNARFYELINAANAEFINFTQSINDGFKEIKIRAILLKIIGFALAFVILWAFLGVKKAALFTAFIVGCACFCLAILLALNVNINIFAIFGLILASAVGVDYCIFAQNFALPKKERILSITLCAMTSIISFALLTFSATNAVSSFGLAVSINLALLAFVSSFYAMKVRAI